MTRDEAMTAINAGADLATSAMAEAGSMTTDEAYNVANLVVCAITTVLGNPEATMIDVLTENFAGTADQWREELGDVVVDAAIARLEAG